MYISILLRAIILLHNTFTENPPIFVIICVCNLKKSQIMLCALQNV